MPGEEIIIEPAGLRLTVRPPSRGVDGRWWYRYELNGRRMAAAPENAWTTLDGDADVHVAFAKSHYGHLERVRLIFDAPNEQRILRAELIKNHH
jgi:hypothetical protein